MKKIIATTNAPAAIGPYSQAVEVNGTIYLSGQIPLDPSTGKLVAGGIKEQTEQVFKNIKAILTEAGLNTSHIVQATVLLASIEDFGAMNEVYAKQFDGDFPARVAYAAKELPANALVEILTVAVR